MQSNLTKIDLPNAQSICYHQEIDGKDFFWKEYKPFVSQSALEVYHAIHAAYGKTRRVKNLDCHLPFGEKEMNRLSYVILPLPDDLQVASTLQNKSEALVTQPQYVSGMTLDEWLQEQGRTDFEQYIMKHIEADLPHTLVDKYHGLSPKNIKVCSLKNGTLYMIITDLAKGIPMYVTRYQRYPKRLRIA